MEKLNFQYFFQSVLSLCTLMYNFLWSVFYVFLFFRIFMNVNSQSDFKKKRLVVSKHIFFFTFSAYNSISSSWFPITVILYFITFYGGGEKKEVIS